MWMTEYIREVKKQFRDRYGFKPDRIVGDELCFDSIPDGTYPMKINGKKDIIRIVEGKIFVGN